MRDTELSWDDQDWSLGEAMIDLQVPPTPEPDPRLAEEAASLSASYDRFVDAAWPILSTDPLIRDWYVDALCEHVEAWCRREILDLMIHVRPRMGKTLLCSVLANAWTWTWDPTAQFLTASFSDSRKKEDARLTRNLVLNPWYQARWTLPMSVDQSEKDRFVTAAGGQRFTAIYGSGATGDGGSHFIVDDGQCAADQRSITDLEYDSGWFDDTWDRRRNQPDRNPSMITCQRLGPRDLANSIRLKAPERWQVLSLQTRKTSVLTGTYYRWREDGTADEVELPLIDTSISRRKTVDPRQPGELLSSRVILSQLNALEESSPATYAAQEQQSPLRGRSGMIALHMFARPTNLRSFAHRMGCPDLVSAIAKARSDGWFVTTGWDHGLDARREICHVIMVSDRLREAWVVATYANQARTTVDQDARAVRAILDRLGIPPRVVVQSRGDVGNVGKGAVDAGLSINQALMQLTTNGAHVLGFPIQLPDKTAGSIDAGVELLNTGFGGGGLNVDESCELLATACEQWTMGGERYKDIVDALRYPMAPILRRWFAVGSVTVR